MNRFRLYCFFGEVGFLVGVNWKSHTPGVQVVDIVGLVVFEKIKYLSLYK